MMLIVTFRTLLADRNLDTVVRRWYAEDRYSRLCSSFGFIFSVVQGVVTSRNEQVGTSVRE
jgi:hypothetical protein